jgi:hypothetical protein
MCRSIRTLRRPYVETVTDADIEAAALQYVRKISGFRTPAAHNAPAFDAAVAAVAEATRALLDQLVVRGAGQAAARAGSTESGTQRD